ncbi:MAG TPA: hypothetical protein VM639_22475 [Dongiaceae bacterium]|nr:hypothetical protein [Dongiaceae bacterium]
MAKFALILLAGGALAHIEKAFAQSEIDLKVWLQEGPSSPANVKLLNEAADILNVTLAGAGASHLTLAYRRNPPTVDSQAVKDLLPDIDTQDIYVVPQLAIGTMVDHCDAVDLGPFLQAVSPGGSGNLDGLLLNEMQVDVWAGVRLPKPSCDGGPDGKLHRYAVPADWKTGMLFFSKKLLVAELQSATTCFQGGFQPPSNVDAAVTAFQDGVRTGSITLDMVFCLAGEAKAIAATRGTTIYGAVIDQTSEEDALVLTQAGGVVLVNGGGKLQIDRPLFRNVLKSVQDAEKGGQLKAINPAANDPAFGGIMPYFEGTGPTCKSDGTGNPTCAFVKLAWSSEIADQRKMIVQYDNNVVWTHIPRIQNGGTPLNPVSSTMLVVGSGKKQAALVATLLAVATAQERKLVDNVFATRFGVYASDASMQRYRKRDYMAHALGFSTDMSPNVIPAHDFMYKCVRIILQDGLQKIDENADLDAIADTVKTKIESLN